MTAGNGTIEADALVIGGNAAGLTLALWLAQNGFKTRLLERAPTVGGIDSSFQNDNGRTFDHGLHCLDYMRSELVTRLFLSAVNGEVNKVERRRGIVLRNHVIRYNAEPLDWPEELRALLPAGELVDRLGTEPPTRENIAKFYGRPFTDMIFDEALASYPSDYRHLSLGVDESRLVRDLYPWFFPRAERESVPTSLSRSYHDRVRRQRQEYILYPKKGGFGGFVEGLRKRVLDSGGEVITGLSDIAFDLDEHKYVRSVNAKGQSFHAPRVYWCARIEPLCEVLQRPVPNFKPDKFVIGSFEFERPVTCEFNELIVADPDHHINRMSFPGSFAAEENNLVQLEFAFPASSSEFESNGGVWLEDWLGSLRRLGIVDDANEMVNFDFKTFPIFYNTFGIEGKPAPEVTFDDIPAESNLRPVLPTYRNVNINTRIPQYLRFLAEDLSMVPPRRSP